METSPYWSQVSALIIATIFLCTEIEAWMHHSVCLMTLCSHDFTAHNVSWRAHPYRHPKPISFSQLHWLQGVSEGLLFPTGTYTLTHTHRMAEWLGYKRPETMQHFDSQSTHLHITVSWRVFHVGWSRAIGCWKLRLFRNPLSWQQLECSQAFHRKTAKDLYLPSVTLATHLVYDRGIHLCAHDAG